MPNTRNRIFEALFFLLVPAALVAVGNEASAAAASPAGAARSLAPPAPVGPLLVQTASDLCAVELEYAGSGGQAVLQRVEATKGQTRSVDRSGVFFVVNVEERPASIRVSTPTGGWTWVRLDDGERNPAVGNYLGGATLSQVRCEYLHDSAVAMYTALTGGGEGDVTAAGAVMVEFELGASELLEELHPHFSGPATAGRVLDEHYGLSLPAIAGMLRDLGYDAEGTMAGLLGAPDPFEGVSFDCGPPWQAMRSAGFTPLETTLAHRATRGGTDGELASCMRSADFTVEEAAGALLEIATSAQPAVLIGLLESAPYGLGPAVRGTATVLGASPLDAAGWLNNLALPAGWSPDLQQQALALAEAFDAQSHQVFGLLRQVGHPLGEVVAAVASAFDADPAEMAGILATTNLSVPQAGAALLDHYPFYQAGVSKEVLLVEALREGGYPAGPVSQGMQILAANGYLDAPSFDEHRLVEWLIEGGYSRAETVAGYRMVFSDLGDFAFALEVAAAVVQLDDALAWAQPIRDAFGVDGPTLMQGVVSWGLSHAMYATGEVFGAAPPQVLEWVLSWWPAGGSTGNIGNSLAFLYSPEPGEAAEWMRQAGFTTQQAFDALWSGWDLVGGNARTDAHAVMVWLVLAGFDRSEIPTVVADGWSSVTAAEVMAWMQQCSNSVCPPPSPRPTHLAFENANVVEGRTVVATVSVDAPIPEGAVAVQSSNPTVAPVPDSVPTNGGLEATFEFRAGAVSSRTPVTITVSGDGESRSAELSVSPEPVTLSGIQLEARSVTSGGRLRGSIEIRDMPSRAEPVDVALSLERVTGTIEPSVVTLDPSRPRAAFVVEVPVGSRAVTTSTTAYVVATSTIGDRRQSFTVEPAEVRFFADPARVALGQRVRLVVELAEPAPSRTGTSLVLSTDRPDLVDLPDRLDVAAGRTRAEVEVATADPRRVRLDRRVVITIEAAMPDGRTLVPVASARLEIAPR